MEPETKPAKDLDPMVPWHTEVVPQPDGSTAYLTSWRERLPPESTTPAPAQCAQALGAPDDASKD